MLWRPEDTTRGGVDRQRVVVAGPGSTLTIPGIIVSEIVRALAKSNPVTRIEVDLTSSNMTGLHRAPSLTGSFGDDASRNVDRRHAPEQARLRTQVFRDLIGPDVGTVIAYAWPGIDNNWIRQFLRIGKSAGAATIVICASLPHHGPTGATSLAEIMAPADRVFVGDIDDASSLATVFGARGPVVEVHRALSLKGKASRHAGHEITAFLPKDNAQSLSTLLKAFDAIPEAWIKDYTLRVVMRYSDDAVPELLASSHYADHVTLLGEDMGSRDLEEICATSSALGVADPTADSRAFASAVESGVATVLLLTSRLPRVGRGYAGGLLADLRRPASVNVALNHALRLEELHFPSPDAWDRLARRLRPVRRETTAVDMLQAAAND